MELKTAHHITGLPQQPAQHSLSKVRGFVMGWEGGGGGVRGRALDAMYKFSTVIGSCLAYWLSSFPLPLPPVNKTHYCQFNSFVCNLRIGGLYVQDCQIWFLHMCKLMGCLHMCKLMGCLHMCKLMGCLHMCKLMGCLHMCKLMGMSVVHFRHLF